MSFASVTPTIDWFEVVQFVALLAALGAVVADVRHAWGNAQWAIDDADPFMRRLGPVQFGVATLQLAIVLLLLGMVVALMQTASPLQSDAVDGLGLLVAVVQRWGGTLVALFLLLIALANRWVRRYAADRPALATDALEQGRRLEGALAENTALTKDAAEKATEAYHEANTVNLAIARLGLGLKEVQADVQDVQADVQDVQADVQDVQASVPSDVDAERPLEPLEGRND